MLPVLRRAAAGLVVLLSISVWFLGAQSNDFRFAILGDRTGLAQPGIYEKIWKEIDIARPDFVINVGDTIEGGVDAQAVAEWTALQPTFRRYSKYPLYFTPGNHDIWSDHSERLYTKVTGRPPAYSFDFQNAHFTVLDNSRTDALSDEQIRFLEKDLEKHQSRSPKFVFFHRPFWVIPLKFGSGKFPLHELAVKHKVRAIISGHAHQFIRIVRDDVEYLAIGSSGGHLRGHDPLKDFKDGWFYHHARVRVRGVVADITINEIGPPEGKGRSFRTEDWSAPDRPRAGIYDPPRPDFMLAK